MYDGFFKELMNPEYTPERLNEFLSLLLKNRVKIQEILPNDSTRITDESSLLIMDIVVKLEDGSLANIEVQKFGYHFPGQRSACYSADLLLRQYKRVRGERGKQFTYKDIKSVYTIVLLERSTEEFHLYPKDYLHYFEQQSDTGLEMALLQKFLFVPLDIFRRKLHNKAISNKLEAWLLFFSSDDPKDVLRLTEEYPEFHELYEQAYQICRNVENVMGIFSEELRILDRNTVQLMIDEMQDQIDAQKEQLNSQKAELDSKQSMINSQKDQLDSQKDTINSQKAQLDSQKDTISSQKDTISSQKDMIDSLREEIARLQAQSHDK